MEAEAFDRFAKLLGNASSRRLAVGTIFGASLIAVEAGASKRRRKRGEKKTRRAVTTEAADCANPGPDANLNGCNFNDAEFAYRDLSSSSMAGATFRGANLCGADLSSSQLRNADFRGLSGSNKTNLTRADLSSSGCRGTSFNENTIFCETKMCNGAVRSDDCPGGLSADYCCTDEECPPGSTCLIGVCSCGGDACAANECCNGSSCAPGNQFTSCGANGATCDVCTADEVCTGAEGCQACSAATGGTLCDALVDSATLCTGGFCNCVRRLDGSGGLCTNNYFCNPGDRICNTDDDCVAKGMLACVPVGSCNEANCFETACVTGCEE